MPRSIRMDEFWNIYTMENPMEKEQNFLQEYMDKYYRHSVKRSLTEE